MPELPEVEHFRQVFRRLAAGKRVAEVWADPTILRNSTVDALRRALVGRRLHDPERRGKWLLCPSDGPILVLHFGMTGDLVWSGDQPLRHRHDRLALAFVEGGELRYRNMRKLGGVWLAHDDAEVGRLLSGVGPDALALDAAAFVQRLGRRRGGVKAALMDQSVVAGIGNILADEILWQARLHPRRTVESLDAAERSRLARVTRRVLHRAVEEFDTPEPRSSLSPVRGLPGAACPRCRTPLGRTTAAGRTTYFCPRCQPAPDGPTMGP
jgi:formamidopyrimidine-DNA glycosylase